MEANFFTGTDTYGTWIQVGINKDGVQFSRAYTYNGYGMGWEKWQRLEEPCEIIDGDTPEIKWGWNKLQGCFTKGIRLPKIK